MLPGASPETMEREVTQVIEESVNNIEGIRSLRSASSDGLALLFVEFELSYDIQEKAQQVRERVAAVRGELPPDIEPPDHRPGRSRRDRRSSRSWSRVPTTSGAQRASPTSASSLDSSASRALGASA